jgi:hypothetical protein
MSKKKAIWSVVPYTFGRNTTSLDQATAHLSCNRSPSRKVAALYSTQAAEVFHIDNLTRGQTKLQLQRVSDMGYPRAAAIFAVSPRNCLAPKGFD